MLPIKYWMPEDEIEGGAREQIDHVASLPFAVEHVAVMPDCHSGYGMPIGCVFASKGYIVPNAVGVDIGCGMLAVRTDIKPEIVGVEELKKILGGSAEYKGGIRSTIPTGFSHHSRLQNEAWMPQFHDGGQYPIVLREYERALRQVGTLGGGNHFIELQKGSDGFLWFMIHSGSRNLGFQVAHHYAKIAAEENANNEGSMRVPPKWELDPLYIDSEEGQAYWHEMQYCVQFAQFNRAHMSERIKEAISNVFVDVKYTMAIDIPHNYATMVTDGRVSWDSKQHDGWVILHRKGATNASQGSWGVIPGSQGTSSFIVRGLGNKDSFNSCSHGAGRKMGRKQAQRELDLGTEMKRLDDKGILHAMRGKADLDEAPGAYKDIVSVMMRQKDLVMIDTILNPLAVVKA